MTVIEDSGKLKLRVNHLENRTGQAMQSLRKILIPSSH